MTRRREIFKLEKLIFVSKVYFCLLLSILSCPVLYTQTRAIFSILSFINSVVSYLFNAHCVLNAMFKVGYTLVNSKVME